MSSHLFFRPWSYLRHVLSAWNTGGEGIHSPYLFYLVRFLMYDTNAYYSWHAIERRRQEMLRTSLRVSVQDFGTGRMKTSERLVRDIARTSLKAPKYAQLLFRWLRYMGENKGKPLQIVELGTSLGITTSYLASVHSCNQVLTFEGSARLLEIAQRNWDELELNNIEAIPGNIDDTLSDTLYTRARCARNAPYQIDMAFLDANHTYDATIRYWETLLLYHKDTSIYVLDDIHHSPEMEKAWRAIQQYPAVTSTMDLYSMGVVFFDPQFIHRHYKLRY